MDVEINMWLATPSGALQQIGGDCLTWQVLWVCSAE